MSLIIIVTLLVARKKKKHAQTIYIYRYLHSNCITNVLVAGLITSVCVHHTAFTLFDAGFQTSVIGDCCADRTRSRHEAALSLYGDYMYSVLDFVDLTTTSL